MTMQVNTGFGFFRRKVTGKIIAKFQLPAGIHPLSEHLEYFEVADKNEFDAIEVEKEQLTAEQTEENLIQNKIRTMAIERLVSENILQAEKYGITTDK